MNEVIPNLTNPVLCTLTALIEQKKEWDWKEKTTRHFEKKTIQGLTMRQNIKTNQSMRIVSYASRDGMGTVLLQKA